MPAYVKEYEWKNVANFEVSGKANHNLMTVEQNNGELECLMELFSAGLAV